MEDALREDNVALAIKATDVLILVLMEDALRECQQSGVVSQANGLNPCSNGRCSASSWYKDYN